MLLILRTELEKLLRQKKTWLTVTFLNLVGIGVLVLVLVLPLIGALDPEIQQGIDEFVGRHPTKARGFLIHVFVLWANTFSLLSTFFLALLAGGVVAAEFEDDSVQMYLVAPVRRIEVWLAKVLAVFSVYGSALLAGLALMGVALWRAVALQPSLSGMLTGVPLWKVFGAYALVDLTTLAFFMCVSAFSRSGTSAALTGLGLFMVSSILDFFFWLFHEFESLPRLLEFWMNYSFTRTCRVLDIGAVSGFLRKGGDGLPVDTGLLTANLAWLAVFLALGYWVFSRRESRPET